MSGIEKKLQKQVVQASQDYGLIQDGDHIMVCMSGGKDSYVMLHLLQCIQKKAPFDFSLTAVNLDQGHPGFPGHVLEEYFQQVNVPYKMLTKDTYSIVTDKIPIGKAYCSLCSRLRRGILYNAAVDLGCNKIALGHHRDDIIETLMLNILYSGQIKAMSPHFLSDDERNTVIRPLAYCSEEDIQALSQECAFPIIPCNLCGSQENLKRKKVKGLIDQLHQDNPHVRGNMFNALRNVRPGQLLDPKLNLALAAKSQIRSHEEL